MNKKLKNKKLIEIGQRVIDRETNALSALSISLDESFSSAIALIMGASGRVIVSGMGTVSYTHLTLPTKA